jgi:predicted nucleic acid-binding protein
MILVDTSVWVEVLRDKTGRMVQALRERIGADIGVFSRFTQLELLQGAEDEGEWSRLDKYLATQYYLDATDETWPQAARIYFDLRRGGITINSPIDCCIAQLAIEAGALLLHQDGDFEKIAGIRPLLAERFPPG